MRAPYLLCLGLVAAGWDGEIIAIATPENAKIQQAWGQVPVYKISGQSKRSQLIRLAQWLLRPRPGRIAISWVWYWHCFALVIAKILYRAPYVIVLDTYTHCSGHGFWAKLRESLRYGLILRWADIILAETPAAFESTRQYARHAETLLAAPGLWLATLQQFEEKWQSNAPVLQREPIILFVGRFARQKRIHDLITAFAKLTDRHPTWQLELRGPVSDPLYFAELEALVNDLGLRDRIAFLPGLSGEALYQRYRTTAIYALPSEGEGFPTTVLEAMYFGGAIVAGNSGYVGYQLDEGTCGLLHEPGDVEQLTKHLQCLMGSEAQRQALRTQAQKRMVNLFTWEAHFPTLEYKLRKLITPSVRKK